MNTRNSHNESNDEAEQYLFTCKNCGSHNLYVEHYYTVWQGNHRTKYVKRGVLNIDSTDEHRVEEWDDPEEVDYGREGSIEIDEENETEDTAIDDKSHEYYVACMGCDREIEFGWSHRDRGGRIWPSECIDFNPWLCWPEPRYREKWAKKKWLRPTNNRQHNTD